MCLRKLSKNVKPLLKMRVTDISKRLWLYGLLAVAGMFCAGSLYAVPQDTGTVADTMATDTIDYKEMAELFLRWAEEDERTVLLQINTYLFYKMDARYYRRQAKRYARRATYYVKGGKKERAERLNVKAEEAVRIAEQRQMQSQLAHDSIAIYEEYAYNMRRMAFGMYLNTLKPDTVFSINE